MSAPALAKNNTRLCRTSSGEADEIAPLLKTTSVSLLERLQAVSAEADWQRLQEIYLPLICHWLARIPGLKDDAADLAQEVFVVLIREIPSFRRQREGSFRTWLRQVTINRVRSHSKRQDRRPMAGFDPADRFLEQLADPKGDLAQEWDREHDRHVFEKLLGIVQPGFGPKTWQAFQRFAIQGIPAAQVASELQMTENAVLLAKSRILKRLRLEAGELLD
jgi:RNA polymerase sigma-70 factor (ECF subfamily)